MKLTKVEEKFLKDLREKGEMRKGVALKYWPHPDVLPKALQRLENLGYIEMGDNERIRPKGHDGVLSSFFGGAKS